MSKRSTGAFDRQERLLVVLRLLLLLCLVNISHGEDGVCEDCPPGWYDSVGPEFNCAWYAANNYCTFGDAWANFGFTAAEACCGCDGGTTRGCDLTAPPTMAPTAAETLPADCEECPLGWYDSDGEEYTCEWYGSNNFCDDGAPYANFGVTANEACCECGATTATGTCTLSIDAGPTPTVTTPTFAPGSCSDCYLGWYDADGEEYTCEWYGANEAACASYGDAFENFGYTANQACCECGGGCALAPTLSPAPTSACTDCEGWYDRDGSDYNCTWYEDNDYCEFAEGFSNFGLSAVDACCYCGGLETTTCDIQPSQGTPSFTSPSVSSPSYGAPTYGGYPTYGAPTYGAPTYGGVPTYGGYPTYTFPTFEAPPVSAFCEDSPSDWYDGFGEIYNCQWYEDNNFCQYAEFYPDSNGVTGQDACCACGGGTDAGVTGTFVMIPTNVKNAGFERDEQWVITDGNPMRECDAAETMFGECYFHFSGGSGEQRIEQVIADAGEGSSGEIFNLIFYARGIDLPGKKFFKGYIKTSSGSSKHSYPCRSTRDGTFDFRMMKCNIVLTEDFDEMAIIFKYMGDSGDVYLDRVILERGNQIE